MLSKHAIANGKRIADMSHEELTEVANFLHKRHTECYPDMNCEELMIAIDCIFTSYQDLLSRLKRRAEMREHKRKLEAEPTPVFPGPDEIFPEVEPDGR